MKQKITTLIGLMVSATLFAGPTEDLFEAIKQGNYDKFKAAIAAGADVNAFDNVGNTPLLSAIYYPEMVRDLIAAKADVNKFNKTNMTSPLMAGCGFGETEIVTLLIDAGADVNGADALFGFTPLFIAFHSALPVDGIKLLIAKGANTKHINKAGNNLLEFFSAGGQAPSYREEKMKEFAAYYKGIGAKVPPVLEENDIKKWSTLQERLEVVLSFGFDVNAQSPYIAPFTTPNAAELNKTNAKFGLKIWPLFLAMTNYGSRAEMAKLLIEKGADVNKKFGDGKFGLNRTLLHAVALQGDKVGTADIADLVKVLVEAGIKMNDTDGPGFTAVMYAAQIGNTSFVKAILPHNPDLNVLQKEVSNDAWTSYQSTTYVTKKTYRTARDWAAEGKHTAAYDLIKNAGGKGASEVK